MNHSEVETAYAKINLALHVRGRMEDGYHAIETLFAFLDDGDRLGGTLSDNLSLELIGPFASVLKSDDADNLVLKAARRMADAFAPGCGATLLLDKRLPVASGIGGGSADAAAAIRLLNRLWGLHLPLTEYHALAAELGADVPACLYSRSAVGSGRGDDLRFLNVEGLDGRHILLANPGVGVSTADIFRRWDGTDGGPLPASQLAVLHRDARNDLERPAVALVPAIGDMLSILRAHSDFARMSGSGATCFALFDSHHDVMTAQDALQRTVPNIWTMAGLAHDGACVAASPAPEQAAT